MAVPAYQGSGTRANSSGSTSVTPAITTTSITPGDLIFLVCGSKNNDTHSSSSADWEKIDQRNSGTNWTVSLWVYKVKSGVTPPATTISWATSSANFAQTWSLEREDYESTLSALSAIGTVSANTGTGSPHTVTGFTSAADNSLAMYVGASPANTAYGTSTNYTERLDNGSATGTTRNVAGTRNLDAAGSSSGNVSITSTTANWVLWLIEVKEAVFTGTTYTVASDAADVTDDTGGNWTPQRLIQGGTSPANSLGVYFPAIDIPQGATITYAQLILSQSTSIIGLSGTTWGTLYGDDVDNAAAFSTTDRPSGITKTTAQTAVKAIDSDGAAVAHDVLAIVQEIVNRPGWASGNAIRFAGDPTGADGTSRYYDYAQDTTKAAKLLVQFTSGGPAGIVGTATITMDPVQSSSSSALALKGAGSPSLADVTTTTAAAIALKGNGGLVLDDLTSSGLGGVKIGGTLSYALEPITASGGGRFSLLGSLNAVLDDVLGSGAAALKIKGDSSGVLDAVLASGVAKIALAGSGSAAIDQISLSSGGKLPITGGLSLPIGEVLGSGTGQLPVKGQGDGYVGDLGFVSTGSLAIKGAVVATLEPITLSASVGTTTIGNASIQLDTITSSAEGRSRLQGVGAPNVGEVLLTGIIEQHILGQAAINLDEVTASAQARLPLQGGSNATLEDLVVASTASIDIASNSVLVLEEFTLDSSSAIIIDSDLGYILEDFALEGYGTQFMFPAIPGGRTVSVGFLGSAQVKAKVRSNTVTVRPMRRTPI